MTDLKKNIRAFISETSRSYLQTGSRLYPLYRELVAASKKDVNKGDIVPFERPCLIGGQTFSDQTGFGSEYYGGDLVYQGKEYGETTKFLMIGVIIDT